MGDLVPVLDNLISSKKLPPMVAVFIAAGPGDGTGSERSWEYDKVSPNYVMFVETEVLPKIQTDHNVKFTTNPEGRGMMGGSYPRPCSGCGVGIFPRNSITSRPTTAQPRTVSMPCVDALPFDFERPRSTDHSTAM